MIPVTVIVATKNEERRIANCLAALDGFQDIIVVDSQSQDKTADVVRGRGVTLVEFTWNKLYPKKRQWCLDTLDIKTDWISFVDADEIVTPELKAEIAALFQTPPLCAGYFVTGAYSSDGKVLRFGMKNNKLILFNRHKITFPVVDDLDIPGMGEMEGHYQPVLKTTTDTLGQLRSVMIHDTLDDERAWNFRHDKYARWEAGMNAKDAWPTDPVPWRQTLKSYLRRSKFRPQLVFVSSYILMGGILDGAAGKKLAQAKARYYKKIQSLSGTGSGV